MQEAIAWQTLGSSNKVRCKLGPQFIIPFLRVKQTRVDPTYDGAFESLAWNIQKRQLRLLADDVWKMLSAVAGLQCCIRVCVSPADALLPW